MLTFWLPAALLLLAALSFLWLPALIQRRRQRMAGLSRQELNIQAFETQQRDLQAEYDAGRIDAVQYAALETELQKRLLGDVETDMPVTEAQVRPVRGFTSTAVVLSVLVVAGAAALYLNLGNLGTLSQMADQQALAQRLSELPPAEQLALLEDKAQAEPERTDIWYALANFYFQQARFAQSAEAYRRLIELAGEQPALLSEYAQTLFFLNGNRVTGEVKSLAERAVAGQPDNVNALGLLGIAAFENQRYREAIMNWQAAIAAAPQAPGARALRAGIARAQDLLASQAGDEGAARLALQVSLADQLAARAGEELSVFVLARASEGPAMPLAVTRLKVKDLPAEVVLTDAMAMAPGMNLSSAQTVDVVARISQSGEPQPRPGDLQGRVGAVRVVAGQTSVSVVIDSVVE